MLIAPVNQFQYKSSNTSVKKQVRFGVGAGFVALRVNQAIKKSRAVLKAGNLLEHTRLSIKIIDLLKRVIQAKPGIRDSLRKFLDKDFLGTPTGREIFG